MKSLKKLKQEAYDYFQSVSIVPDGLEIVQYVADVLEGEGGYYMAQEEFIKLAEKLKCSID